MLQNTLLWWESLSRVKLGQTADLLKCMRSLGGIKHDSCQPTYCSLSLWKLTASMEEIGQACFLSVINLPKLARLTPGAAPERRQLSERWHDKHIELSAAHPRCHAWPTSPPLTSNCNSLFKTVLLCTKDESVLNYCSGSHSMQRELVFTVKEVECVYYVKTQTNAYLQCRSMPHVTSAHIFALWLQR